MIYLKCNEEGVLNKSDVYFFSPSPNARKHLFYPLSMGHFFCVDGYHLIRERYDSFLISYIIEGTFNVYINGEKVPAEAGSTVILNCYEPHEYDTDSYFESIWLHFDGPGAAELYEFITSNAGNIINCANPKSVKKSLKNLFQALSSKKTLSESVMSVEIYSLMCELLNVMHAKIRKNSTYEKSVLEAQKYINENLGAHLTVASIAKQVHMSVSHFSRIFKQQTGYSPYDYVLVTRLNVAKNCLRETNMSISEIAYKTGFNSESNFIFFFTSNTGISPGKFRKLNF